MNADQENIKENKKQQNTIQKNYSLLVYMATANEHPATGFGEMAKPLAAEHSLWKSAGGIVVVLCSFAIVTFYIIRFAASAWVAGARGIYGL